MTDIEKKARQYLKDSSDYYDSREPITERKMRQIYIDGYEQGQKDTEEKLQICENCKHTSKGMCVAKIPCTDINKHDKWEAAE